MKKRAGWREAAGAQAIAAKIENERLKANNSIITQRTEANGELLAQKAAQQGVMMPKQEALNVRPWCGHPSSSSWPGRGRRVVDELRHIYAERPASSSTQAAMPGRRPREGWMRVVSAW
jgi:hypothetical protein